MANFFYQNNPNMMVAPYQNPQPPVMNNLLSDAERKLIASEGSGLDISRTPVDQARAKCTHKNTHGLCIYPRPDGSGLWECSECHKVFNIVDFTQSEVEELCMKMSDIIENVKAFIPYMAGETGIPAYQALDFAVDVLPKLYAYMLEQKVSMQNAYTGMNQAYQAPGVNTMAQLYQMTNPTNPIGMYQQPMYQQQPMMGMQPMMQPQQPMMPGMYQQQPQQPMMPPAPAQFVPGVYQPQMQQPQQQMMPGMYQQPQNDTPVGVVEQQQVAVSGPTPMTQTAANVPPATTQNVKKSFKA